VKKIEGLTWPCPTPKHLGTSILYTERFETPDGLGKLHALPGKTKAEKQTKKFPFFLTLGRVPAFYYEASLDEKSFSPDSTDPELWVEINPQDAKRHQIRNQSEVKLSTNLGATKAVVYISERVQPGVVFIPFLLNNANGRILQGVDPRAHIPELNATTCQLKVTGGKKGEQ
jgi:predicted molibdopterin-dependent oxidoreductase YjgC